MRRRRPAPVILSARLTATLAAATIVASLTACSGGSRAAGVASGTTSEPTVSTAAPTPSPTTPIPSAPASTRTSVRATAPAPSSSRRTSSSPSTSAGPSAGGAPSTAPSDSSVPASRPHTRTIVLNPGHNGGNGAAAAEIGRPVPSGFGQTRACDTTGTNTNAGYPEHAFNWDVTQRVSALLRAHGVTVILTRPNDTGVGPCIDERARIGNAVGVAAVVSIHADGAPVDGHGFHICEDSRQPAGPAIAAASHQLTTAIHDTLVGGSGLSTSTYLGNDGYYPRDDLAGLNLATVPATFIELGNMRNAGDAALQSSAGGRQRMAAAIAAGILNWLG